MWAETDWIPLGFYPLAHFLTVYQLCSYVVFSLALFFSSSSSSCRIISRNSKFFLSHPISVSFFWLWSRLLSLLPLFPFFPSLSSLYLFTLISFFPPRFSASSSISFLLFSAILSHPVFLFHSSQLLLSFCCVSSIRILSQHFSACRQIRTNIDLFMNNTSPSFPTLHFSSIYIDIHTQVCIYMNSTTPSFPYSFSPQS